MSNVYAIYTPNGSEELVKDILEKQLNDDNKFIIYRRKLRERKSGQWHMVERKLFPGYVLMKGQLTDEKWQEIRNADCNCKVLKNDDDYLTLSEREIRMLDLLDKDEDGMVGMSQILVDGDHVNVIKGPLEGQEARIVSVNKRKGRAKVSINFCGSERIVELGVEVVKKLMQ